MADKSQETNLRKKITTVMLHTVAVCLLFVVPEVIVSLKNPLPSPMKWVVYGKPLLMIAVFYVNFYLIVPENIKHHKSALRFIAVNILIIAAALGIESLINIFVHSAHAHNAIPDHRPSIDLMMIREIVMYILVVALSLFIRLAMRTHELEKLHSEQLVRQRTDELKRLREQIRPHFLFNTLNTIYALIDIDPDTAKEAVHRVSQMMRHVLYDNAETVTLQKELEFIDNYINLMSLRMPANLPVNVNLNAGNHAEMEIPPMLFINQVENTFKHGRVARNGQGIEISINVTPQGVISCHTSNFIDHSLTSSGNGVGLTNLRRRLNLLFGERASLLTTVEDDKFITSLTIDYGNNQMLCN